jgi:hypothetical protein
MYPASPPAVVLAAQIGQPEILRRLLVDGWPAVVSLDTSSLRSEIGALIRTYQGPAQTPVTDVLRSIRTTATERLPANEIARRIATSATWLLGRAGQSASISEEYATSLVAIDRLLIDVANGSERRPAALMDAAEELADKVAHCKALNIGMGGTVQLEVVTRRGERTVSGWEIFYLLKIYEYAAGRAPERLIGWSSPATGGLEPGRYFFWGVDTASKKVSERILVRLEGKEKIQLPLAVP